MRRRTSRLRIRESHRTVTLVYEEVDGVDTQPDPPTPPRRRTAVTVAAIASRAR
jgi:hypothetical protein